MAAPPALPYFAPGLLHAPNTAPGMRWLFLTAAASSSGSPVPVTSLPTDTQWLCRLFLRAKISSFLPGRVAWCCQGQRGVRLGGGCVMRGGEAGGGGCRLCE